MLARGGTIGRAAIAIAAATLACAAVAGGAPERAAAVTDCSLTPPASMSVSNNPNQSGATVPYPAPTTTGTCATVTCNPASGSFFPVGTTLVTCTASTTPPVKGSFNIRVNDTQPPAVAVSPNITVATDPGRPDAAVSFAAASATDNMPGVTVGCDHVSGGLFAIGATTVTCTAHDSSGLTSVKFFTVTVNDTEPPVIERAPDLSATAARGATSAVVDYVPPGAHDNSTNPPTVTCAPAPGSSFTLGTTVVSCVATDAAANVGTKTFAIVVAHSAVDCAAAQADLKAATQKLRRAKKSGTAKQIKRAKAKVKAAAAAVAAAC